MPAVYLTKLAFFLIFLFLLSLDSESGRFIAPQILLLNLDRLIMKAGRNASKRRFVLEQPRRELSWMRLPLLVGREDYAERRQKNLGSAPTPVRVVEDVLRQRLDFGRP